MTFKTGRALFASMRDPKTYAAASEDAQVYHDALEYDAKWSYPMGRLYSAANAERLARLLVWDALDEHPTNTRRQLEALTLVERILGTAEGQPCVSLRPWIPDLPCQDSRPLDEENHAKP